ncbi:MAG: hydantoinase/oxoprolinase family protein [Nitrososphaeria archaeon]
MQEYYIGVDIGGTFTDVVVYNPPTGNVSVIKVPSTPSSPEEAVVKALKELGIKMEKTALLNHATTVATNALLTKSGLPRTALITNRGFKDVLEIGRQRRPEIYNIFFTKPVPLVPRNLRFEVGGRMLADGSIKEEVPVEDIEKVKKLLVNSGVESAAISLLNSYVNPEHEKKVKESIKDCCKYVFASYEVDPEYREYERTSTTVVNAVLAPVVSSYLERFVEKIKMTGYRGPVYVMSSNGGLNTVEHASRMPISIIESGPAAGVLASSFLAKEMGIEKAITFDMGGTTAKAGAVVEGNPDISYEFEAAGKTHSGRSIKGSGYAVRFPFIDLAEVSAGGGTVAWVDEAKVLRVGPRSAGADPGPAAYGRGGKDPTVTDANIVLGRLNRERLLGGKMKVYTELAEEALRKIGKLIGTDIEETAKGIIKLINNSMAKAISIVSVERGRDPRDFTMIAFGGAGPLHACDLAEEMGIKEIVVPDHPGLFSAYGLLTVDITRSYKASVFGKDLKETFEKLKNTALEELQKDGFNDVEIKYFVDMRYRGQSYEITIEYDEGSNLKEKFEKEHKRIYGYSSEDPVEAVEARLLAIAKVPHILLKRHEPVADKPQPSAYREAYVSGKTVKVPVYVKEKLKPGSSSHGPAIIEEYDSTTVVNEGWSWEVDGFSSLVLRRG